MERVSAVAYLIGWRLIRALPERLAYSLFYILGERAIKRNSKRIQRFRFNLQRVKPELSPHDIEKLLSCAMRSYMRYWCDTFRFPGWKHERIISTVSVTNEHLVMEPLNQGKGVVVALPHSGNWDHAGSFYCAKGVHLVTVAEHLKPELVFQKFLKYREKIGMEVLDLDSRSIVTLMERARQGGLIALVADRDLSHSGIEVDFFGAIAKMPAGPALVGIRTGVDLLTASVTYTEKGIHIYFRRVEIPSEGDERERVSHCVQSIARNFEAGISSHPQDWHMLQRIWLDQP